MADLLQILTMPVETSTAVLVGGTVDFYKPGTTGESNRKDVYTDKAGTIVAANPFTLGPDATATLYGVGLYHIIIKDSGSVGRYDYDNVSGVISSTDLTSTVVATVSDMVADTTLVVGDFVNTSGRTTSGDGGDNQYEIVAAGTGTDDGGSFIDLDTHQAKGLFPGGLVNAVQFGAVSGDDAESAFNSACAYVGSLGGGDLFAPPGDWEFSIPVVVPVGVYIKGTRGTNFIPASGFTGDVLFLLNTLAPDNSGFVEGFPGQISGGFAKCNFDNFIHSVPGIRAIKFAGSQEFIDTRFKFFAQSIVQDGDAYSDNVKIANFLCRSLDADTDWQIDLDQGDGADINQLHFIKELRTLPPVGINAVRRQSIRVKNVIGGKHRFALCNSGDVEIYTETGFVEVNSSSISLKLHSYLNQTTSPVTLLNDAGGNHRVRLLDCKFNYGLNKTPIDVPDVVTSSAFEVEVVNCVRLITVNGVTGQENTGIRMVDSGASPVTRFNNFSYLNSRLSTVLKDNRVVSGYTTADPGTAGFTGITSATVSAEGFWDEAQDTYYYDSQLLLDPVRDLGSNGGAEVSVVVGAANKAVVLPITFGIGIVGIVRVYRGTSAGSYDAFADIHIMSLSKLYDVGSTINGVTWTARGAAGVNSLQITPTKLRTVGDEIEVWADDPAHPTTGTWSVGDVIHNSTPSVDGSQMIWNGRLCLTAGTPSSPTTHPRTHTSTVTPAT